MKRHTNVIMQELHALMDLIVGEGKEVDYVAILNFADNLPDIDVILADRKTQNPKRTMNKPNLLKTIGLERESYKVNPYDDDKMLNAREHLYRFCPTGIEHLVLMFACFNHGDVDTFRFTAHSFRQQLVDKLKEL